MNKWTEFVDGTDIEKPSQYQRIWRYLSLPAFVYLLVQRRLHFSRPWQMDDRWEGRISRMQINELLLDLEDAQHLNLAPQILQIYVNFVASCAISCWHASDTESVAMWKLYATGPDGIAISTTVEKVQNSLTQSGERNLHLHVGTVQYIDHEANVFSINGLENRTALQCLFEKRNEYSHEREVRFVLVNPKETEISLTDMKFIERVTTSPEFPTWAVSSLQSMLAAVGSTVAIEPSKLAEVHPRAVEKTDHVAPL